VENTGREGGREEGREREMEMEGGRDRQKKRMCVCEREEAGGRVEGERVGDTYDRSKYSGASRHHIIVKITASDDCPDDLSSD
jgi:hypothetical protein